MFDSRELRNIAKTIGYTDSPGYDEELSQSKAERWDAIQSDSDLNKKQIAAAIEIQRIWRGYRVRSHFFDILNDDTSIINSDSLYGSQKNSYLQNGPLVSRNSQTLSTSEISIDEIALANKRKTFRFIEFCCMIIQRWWRSTRARRKLANSKLKPIEKRSSFSQQSSFDTNFVQKSNIHAGFAKQPRSSRRREMDAAAIIIQRSWRQHVDMQVFRYYKDLVNFKAVGGPAAMLRCINPKESHLLDSASGLHVRFRLGGETFPPNVYYKIFTNRNIADVGAFAPRNYTKPHMLPMKYVHNKSKFTQASNIVEDSDDKSLSGWYKRTENNGWRLVSVKLMQDIYRDSVTFSSSTKKTDFHHSKMVRKEDLEKKRKRKKIEWMKKMYREGAAENADPSVRDLIQATTTGMIAAAEAGFEVSIEDWEVDELLEWTNTLNFDQYLNDWKDIGTTSSSSQPLGQMRNSAVVPQIFQQ